MDLYFLNGIQVKVQLFQEGIMVSSWYFVQKFHVLISFHIYSDYLLGTVSKQLQNPKLKQFLINQIKIVAKHGFNFPF